MADDARKPIGEIVVEGGSVKFAYGPDGAVTGTFEDVVYKGAPFEKLLHDDWRDVVARAAGDDTHARQVALDDIASAARVAEVHREAHEALVANGGLSSPEAAYLARSFVEKLERIKARYGDIVRMPGQAAVPAPAQPATAAKVPDGFEDTPRTYGPDGAPSGYDLSKGFVAPAGFRVRFLYGEDGTVTGFHADAKVGMDTLTRMLLKPDWNVAFEAHVVKATARSWFGRVKDWLRRKPPVEPAAVRTEMSERFASLLLAMFAGGQALLGLERAGLGKLYEAGYLRRRIEDARRQAAELVGGKDVFQ